MYEIVPTASIFHKVTSPQADRNHLPERVQVTALVDEQIGSGQRKVIIQRSITFHMELQPDGLYRWHKVFRVQGREEVVDKFFKPSQLPWKGKKKESEDDQPEEKAA